MNNKTLIREIFFLSINHQTNHTNITVKTFGNAPSKLSFNMNGVPSDLVATEIDVTSFRQDASIATTII